MGLADSLGKLAKDWARSKATELLTADADKRQDAAARSDDAEQGAQSAVSEQAVRAAFPKLAAYADHAEEQRRQRDEARDAAEQADLAALPRAQVTLRISGAVDWHWSGELPLRWAMRPTEDLLDPTTPELAVELAPLAAARPRVDADHELTRLAFVLPGYSVDATYDLAATYRARQVAGTDDYLDWGVDLGEDTDFCFYFYPDAGPSTVAISDGGRRIDLSLSTSGAVGSATVTAEITRSEITRPA